MSTQAVQLFAARIKDEEGERNDAYDDATGKSVRAPVGNLTWGRGYNLAALASPALFDVMDAYLIGRIDAQLSAYAWYQQAGAVRQSVFLDIAYNAGVEGLLHFPRMIAAAGVGNWTEAASECKVSNVALNTSRYGPLRALLLSNGVTTK